MKHSEIKVIVIVEFKCPYCGMENEQYYNHEDSVTCLNCHEEIPLEDE